MCARATVPLLLLTSEEIVYIRNLAHAVIVLNPCLWPVASSPVWKCVTQAHSYDCEPYGHAPPDSTAECTCDLPKNEWNTKVEAKGYGPSGFDIAETKNYLWFEVPARPNAATVDVDVLTDIHGAYQLVNAQYPPTFELTLEANVEQYGISWKNNSIKPLDLSGGYLGRFDEMRSISLPNIPLGADPFEVEVIAKLKVTAKGGGCQALADFATGNGNYIRTIWVNTYG